MKVLNDNVFMERLPVEETFNGINISEKACVKNYISVIKYHENEKLVGKKTHVPHYGVEDVEFDGNEYAMCKNKRLFAVMEEEEWHPINGYVKIRKCENDHIRDESGEIALYMTDNNIETTNWVEVLEVAEDCKYVTKKYVGLFTHCPENNEQLARIGYSKDFCLHESLIEFLTTGD